MSEAAGGVIVLQMQDGKVDFYPIKASVFAETYSIVSLEDVAAKNEKLSMAMSSIADFNQLLTSSDKDLIAILKTKPTEMVRLSSLGFGFYDEVEVEAPWGGTQTKPAGVDAFFVLPGETAYMINAEESGLPISYIPSGQ